MNKIKIKSVTTVALISIVALSITGCGGGSGSSSNTRAVVDPTATANANTDSIVQSNANTIVATSKTGFTFTNGAAGAGVTFTADTADSVSIPLPLNYNNEEVITRKDYSQVVNDGTFYVEETLIAYGDDANEYLSLGAWNYYSEDSPNVAAEIGVFAGGGDRFTQVNLDGLTGTASYSGAARGVVADDDDSRYFDGSLSLAADFNDNTISGDVTSLTVTNSFSTSDIAGTLNLNSADIDTTVIGGAWAGIATFVDAESVIQATGNWGGQFLGNGASATDNPEYAVGTFSLEGSGDDNFIAGGVFHAKKN